MRKSAAKQIALGGVLAALAIVIMSLVGLIPVATFVCPLLCTIMGCTVLRLCEKRIAWAWYGVVAILSLLIGPDKEAAAVYLIFGYYPMVKPSFDRFRFSILLKLVYFNAAVALLYSLVLYLLGLSGLLSEYQQLGIAGLAVTLLLGNATFLLLDQLLKRIMARR